MTSLIDRRQALRLIGGTLAGCTLACRTAQGAGASPVIIGFGVKVRAPGQVPSIRSIRANFPYAAMPADPSVNRNVSHKVYLQTSEGWGLAGLRVDAQYRAVGTSSWTYYGAQTSASDGFATFNPFYLPSREYDIEYYVTRNGQRYSSVVRIQT